VSGVVSGATETLKVHRWSPKLHRAVLYFCPNISLQFFGLADI
jgi:hypothetical protein